MARVLIVGAGLTGSFCACLLRREMANKVQIVVWDKSRGAGGRMSTSRSPSDASCTVDLGAQYISATPYYAQIHHNFYEELLAHGILEPLVSLVEDEVMKDGGHKNYVTPTGVSSIIKYFLNHSGAEVLFDHHVTHIYRKGAFWEVCPKGRSPQHFSAVVLTMPVPQILQLQGDLGSLLEDGQRKQLEAVSYSSRYALGLFYKAQTHIPVPWAAKYISNSPCIRFISIDNKKRNLESAECGASMVVHTSVPFGIKHLEKAKDEVEPIILQELNKLLPHLPKPDNIKCHRWRYSQIPSSRTPSKAPLHLLSSSLLISI